MNDDNRNISFNLKGEQARRKGLRLNSVTTIILFLFGAVGLRLVQIQIVDSLQYREVAQKQYRVRIPLPAERGIIYDRNGNIIASNLTRVSFAADPKLAAEDAGRIAQKFSTVFGRPKSYYAEKLRSESRFVWLERMVDARYQKEINSKKISGIVVRQEPKRLYYNGHIAGQLVGTTDIDNFGIAGIEREYDRALRGKDGYVIFQRDGRGKARPSVDYPRVDPVNGNNIYLTIDMHVQSIAERELKIGIEQNEADRGLAVVLHVKTGEVLALAQYPNVDPNNFGKFKLEDQRLRAVTDLFEPGSVFKVVTVSAALEHGIAWPEKQYFAENGIYTVDVKSSKPRKIRDTHKAGLITFREAVEMSSNIVMAKVSDVIGGERFYKTARDYGFGITTNIDFPGEAKGLLKKPLQWSGTTLNTIAYGYEVCVTPIQIVSAYAAVANDGILMKPYLFKKETDAAGTIIRESRPQAIRRVTSEKTTRTLVELLQGVIEHGTATSAKIHGIKIAGKTGTSKKFIEGRYESGNYIASFVGFFPSDDPEIACLVMIDNPRGSSYYGGSTSGPVFRSIAEQILGTTDFIAPARKIAADTAEPAGAKKYQPPTVSPLSDMIPDVRGLSVRRAVSILKECKLRPEVRGSGLVIDEIPNPGSEATSGMKITLVCRPKSADLSDLK